jgi:hypothetical protein
VAYYTILPPVSSGHVCAFDSAELNCNVQWVKRMVMYHRK